MAEPVRHNLFLASDYGRETKGSGLSIEDPADAPNFVFQTRGGPLTPFEERLATELMEVFGEGITELPDIVARLDALGSRDAGGAAWSEDSLASQLARSADALFAPVDGGIRG